MSDSDSDSASSVISHSYENLFIDDDDYNFQYRIWRRTAALLGIASSIYEEDEDKDELSDVDLDEDYDLHLFKSTDETFSTEKSLGYEALFILSNRTSKILSVWIKLLDAIKDDFEFEDKCRMWDYLIVKRPTSITQSYQLFRYNRGLFHAWSVRRILTEFGGEENCKRYQKSILKKLCELKVLMLKNVLSGCLPPLPDLILEYIANCFIEDEEASTSLCSHLSYNNEEGRILHKQLFQALCDIYNEWRMVLYNLNDGIYLNKNNHKGLIEDMIISVILRQNMFGNLNVICFFEPNIDIGGWTLSNTGCSHIGRSSPLYLMAT